MRVAIHQLHYLPWLRYFEKIARADVFVALDDVQFVKSDWHNRNKIKTANGTALLTVPVRHRLGQRLDEVEIENRENWRKKHWETIRQAYGKTPYFDAYAHRLEAVYARTWDRLSDLNRFMLHEFLDLLGIGTRIEFASALAVPGGGTARLVALVRAVGGTSYYSGAYALQVYLDAEELARAGIALELQAWASPVYPQLHGDYVPDLSIVDLLMNCGPASLDVLRRGAGCGP